MNQLQFQDKDGLAASIQPDMSLNREMAVTPWAEQRKAKRSFVSTKDECKGKGRWEGKC